MSKIILKKIEPGIGLPGGIVKIFGKSFSPWELQNDDISFCGSTPWIEAASENSIITTIPTKVTSGTVHVKSENGKSNKIDFIIPETVTSGVHLVDNPVVDEKGNIYATYSGSRGENTHVSLYKITPYGEKIVYLKGLTNATSLAIDKSHSLYISSRFNGKIYKSVEEQEYELYSQGLGAAFGLAFNSNNDLYAGDRSGSIFKINNDGIAEFFASIPQSYISFHLGFDSEDRLYVTNPTHIGENSIYRINPEGIVEVFYTGHSMFHGFCFDKQYRLYATEAKRNESRLIRIDIETRQSEVVATGTNFIGVCFDNEDNLLLATSNAIFLIKKENL